MLYQEMTRIHPPNFYLLGFFLTLSSILYLQLRAILVQGYMYEE